MLNLKKILTKILNCSYTTGSSGNWKWKKYKDGTFVATYKEINFATGTLTQLGSSGVYYSAIKTVNAPAIGITGIDSVQMTVSPHSNDTAIVAAPYGTTNASTYMRFLRFGGSGSINIDFFYELRGNWA